MQQLCSSSQQPDGAAAPLLEDDFGLDGVWGSSPGAVPMAIDNAHPFGFGHGCLDAASPPSGGSAAHSTANGHPVASAHGGSSDSMGSHGRASPHPSLGGSRPPSHSFSSHLQDSQREQILRASASATAALLPSPPPDALADLQFGELHDVSDLLPSRRSLERGGFEGSSHPLDGGDGGGLRRQDGSAWLPGDEPLQQHPHSNHLETLLEEFCSAAPPPGTDQQHELDLLMQQEQLIVMDPHHSACDDDGGHHPLGAGHLGGGPPLSGGGGHRFAVSPFSSHQEHPPMVPIPQRYNGHQHYNASCDGSNHGSPQNSIHTGSGLARSHASAGGSAGNANTLAGELRSQTSCHAPMLYHQNMQQQQSYVLPLQQQQPYISVQQQQQQPYVPQQQHQQQPHAHQRGLLSAALAAGNRPSVAAHGLLSEQQQLQGDWSVRAALLYQEEQQRLHPGGAPVGCYPADGLAASLHAGGTPGSSILPRGAAGMAAEDRHEQYENVWGGGSFGGALPGGFTFSAPPDPNLLSEVCGSPGGSSYHGSRTYHGGALAASVGGGQMHQQQAMTMAMGGTHAATLAYGSQHGASAYGPSSDGSVRNGGFHYPPQQQQQQGSLSRQSSVTLPIPHQQLQAQPPVQQPQQLQQPQVPLQRLGSLSRHSSQQQLLHLQRQSSGILAGGAPSASLAGEAGGGTPSSMYDALLNGSMRGANLFAASMQQQQQGGGKRSLDLSGAPPVKGSRGIVLDLADVPEMGQQQQQGGGRLGGGFGASGAGFPRIRSALVLPHGALPGSYDGSQSSALLRPGGSSHGASLACNALSASPSGSGVLKGAMASWGAGCRMGSAASAQEGALAGSVQEGAMAGSVQEAEPGPTIVQRVDGSFREVDPRRASQLNRYK